MKTFGQFVAEDWDATANVQESDDPSDKEKIDFHGASLPRGTVRSMHGFISDRLMANKKVPDIKREFLAKYGSQYANQYKAIIQHLLD